MPTTSANVRLACLAGLLLVGTAGAAEMAGSAPASAARLGSTVFNWDQLVAKATNVGERRDVTNLPTATLERFECHISTLNPGRESHPPHRHPQEEFIILKAGTLDVFINGRTQRVGPGSMFFFASNDLHNVKNVGDGPATYFVFNLTTAATHAAPTQPAAESASPDKLRSAVFDWAKLGMKATKTGGRREFFNSPTVTCTNLECHATTLNPGASPHAPHHHPDEEIVVVQAGEMEATINGVSHRGGPGSIFFYASNDEHGMKNVGDKPATYHVIRIVTAATPAPAKTS